MPTEETARRLVSTVAAIVAAVALIGAVFAFWEAWSTGYFEHYWLALYLLAIAILLTALTVVYLPWFWTDEGEFTLRRNRPTGKR